MRSVLPRPAPSRVAALCGPPSACPRRSLGRAAPRGVGTPWGSSPQLPSSSFRPSLSRHRRCAAAGDWQQRRCLHLGSRLASVIKLLELRRKPGTILDIGYGNGALLAQLDQMGQRSLVGVEKNPVLGQEAMFTTLHKWRNQPHFITGDGFSPFHPGEIQQAVMAGFGENKIIEILQRDESQALACRRLVFCPSFSSGLLRPYLCFTKKWHIVGEEIVKEYDRFYNTISVEPGPEENVKDELTLFLGPFNMSRPHPFLREYLLDCRKRYFKDWEQMSKNPRKKHLYYSFLLAVEEALRLPQLRSPNDQQTPSVPQSSTEEKVNTDRAGKDEER